MSSPALFGHLVRESCHLERWTDGDMVDQELDDSTKVSRVPNKASIAAIHFSIFVFFECHYESVHNINKIQDWCAYLGLSPIYVRCILFACNQPLWAMTDYLLSFCFIYLYSFHITLSCVMCCFPLCMSCVVFTFVRRLPFVCCLSIDDVD